MKIGILTFHFATNYGAILQSYCLQEYLSELGYDVSIINYKPRMYEFSWLQIIKHPRAWFRLLRILGNKKKESLLQFFREKYLKTTKKYSSVKEFGNDLDDYDVLISGSDQVLNPDFTMYGENGNVSPAYWLRIGREDTKRIGYAVSFGCEKYPNYAVSTVSQWVNKFDKIGVRENTGLDILEQIGYQGSKEVVPDPTLLLQNKLFKKLGINIPNVKDDYTCVYMLRSEYRTNGNVRYIDEQNTPLSMEQWLNTIANAKQMITNSYHGMIMAILSHVPFVVLLESGNLSGMNDRFFTLLDKLNLGNRIAKNKKEIIEILQKPIDYTLVDDALADYGRKGVSFWEECLY